MNTTPEPRPAGKPILPEQPPPPPPPKAAPATEPEEDIEPDSED